MSGTSGSFIKRVEYGVYGVIIFSFLLWSVSTCNQSGEEAGELAEREALSSEIKKDSAQVNDTRSPVTDSIRLQQAKKDTEKGSAQLAEYSRLYITIDKLKLRKLPGLKSEVIMELKLFEEVAFLNEVSDSTTQLNLGYEITDEPWVKVRHPKGQVGWVYGAGVNYYPKKRGGVMD